MRLKEWLSERATRHLGPDAAAVLRSRYLAAKAKTAPLLRAIHGRFGTDDLARHLAERIGQTFEILFVHSSFNALRPMYDGQAIDLVRMLIAYAGPSRTLAMPAFCFGNPALAGASGGEAQFDLRRTPSQMGLPSELFRRTPGVLQSRNPVYRVAALGPLAAALVAGHERAATHCGPGTPFEFMARRDTLILGLGKSVDVLTQVHYAEDAMGDAFPVPRIPIAPVGITLIEGDERIPYRLPADETAWERDMWRLRRILPPGVLREWRFHGAPMFATRAGAFTEAAMAAARRGETVYIRP